MIWLSFIGCIGAYVSEERKKEREVRFGGDLVANRILP